MLLSEQKQKLLSRVAAFEAATGVQLVTTLQPRCDDYPEIPWKAFAAGAAFGTLLVFLLQLMPGSDMLQAGARPGAAMILMWVLGIGLVCTALSLFVPTVARLFLSAARAEGEVRQAAQALFLEHEVFSTRARTGILMLIAAFEHRVVLLADRGLRAQLPPSALDDVIAAMTAALHTGDSYTAFVAGIEKLETLLRARGFAGHGEPNSLPDHLDSHRSEGDAC